MTLDPETQRKLGIALADNYMAADLIAAILGTGGGTPLLAANNLSDLTSASLARTSLGLETAATRPAAAFLSSFGTVPLANLGSGTPAAGEYVDGGTGAWTALPGAGGGSPGGSPGQIQFNSASAFGGFGGWDGTTLTIPGQVALGVGSTATGVNAMAPGWLSTASGYASTASSYGSTAIGRYSNASGSTSTASGNYSTASGNYSTASGYASTASGYHSTASGKYSFASGYKSQAIGDYSNAPGNVSTASGYKSTASGYKSTVTVDGINATASGYGSTASGKGSTASGYKSTASGDYSVASGFKSISRIPYTENASPHIVRNYNSGDTQTEFQIYSGVQNVIFSKLVDLTAVADQSVPLSAGCSFFVDEVGIVLCDVNTMTIDPTIRFGHDTSFSALLAATLATVAAPQDRNAYPPLTNAGQKVLTAGVTSGAIATSAHGRFYWKGILVEDQ